MAVIQRLIKSAGLLADIFLLNLKYILSFRTTTTTYYLFQVYTADAKLGFDDNASFRQRSIFDMEDTTESEPREVEAAKHNLNYVQVKFSELIFILIF